MMATGARRVMGPAMTDDRYRALIDDLEFQIARGRRVYADSNDEWENGYMAALDMIESALRDTADDDR